MIESLLICTNFTLLMYVCGKTFLTGCNEQIVRKDYTNIDGFGNVNVKISDCENIDEKGSIVYCVRCRRIIGYIDELSIAHLQNVRLVQFTPISTNIKSDMIELIMKMRENVGKRKYPVDQIDLLDEPQPKKPKLDLMFVGRVHHFNNINVRTEQDDSDILLLSDSESSFEEMNETPLRNWYQDALARITTHSANTSQGIPNDILSEILAQTPYGSPNPRTNTPEEMIYDHSSSNSSGWSDDESVHNFDFYGSPLRSSTPNSEVATIPLSPTTSNSFTQLSLDAITISSTCSSIDFENHPNFRAVCNTPVLDEYHDSVGNGSSASRSSSPISPNDEMTLNQLMWPFLPANFVDFDMHGNGIYYDEYFDSFNGAHDGFINESNALPLLIDGFERNELDLQAMTDALISTAVANGNLEHILRFLNMLGDAVEML